MNKKEESSHIFKKYGLLVPFILTLFLELLKYSGHFQYSWFWVISPIWIWVGGIFQLFLGALFYEIKKETQNLKNKK